LSYSNLNPFLTFSQINNSINYSRKWFRDNPPAGEAGRARPERRENLLPRSEAFWRGRAADCQNKGEWAKERKMGRIIKPYAPAQLRELHDRNRGDAPNPISAEDLTEFLRQPDFWRDSSSAVVSDGYDEMVDVGVWMQNVYRDLGVEVVVPPAPKFTERQLRSFRRFTFRLFFVPAIGEDKYPASFVKPNWDQSLKAAQIFRKLLPGKWVAVETIGKPNSQSGDYHEDRLAEAMNIRSRFGVSWDDLHDGGLLAKIAKATGFPRKATRLPTAEEWNFLANLMGWLNLDRGEKNLPRLASTNSWEWCENACENGFRLIVGNSGCGGLTNVQSNGPEYSNAHTGFRVLVEL